MPRAFFKLVALAALLHLYIGMRLLPAMGVNARGMAAGIALLFLSSLLVPAGLFASSLRRSRWAGPLTWAALLAMGLFSSLLVLTLLRDVVLLVLTLAQQSGAQLARVS